MWQAKLLLIRILGIARSNDQLLTERSAEILTLGAVHRIEDGYASALQGNQKIPHHGTGVLVSGTLRIRKNALDELFYSSQFDRLILG